MTDLRTKSVFRVAVLSAAVMSLSLAYAAPPASTYEAITRVADRLVTIQNKVTPGYIGTWQGETAFTGSIAAGLVDAYEMTGDGRYRQAAELAGTWMLVNRSTCNFYGDEAYALMRLSQISCNPASNNWRDNLALFYECVRTGANGTQGYIDDYWQGTEVCTSVFYLAHHTMAAYYVNAQDKNVWRENLIKFLARVNGYSDYSGEPLSYWPVYAVGMATWALSETRNLDSTLIKDYDSYSDSYWKVTGPRGSNARVDDLPAILKSHRHTGGGTVSPGSFYCWLDHEPPGAVGYTEDNLSGMVGLAAAQKNYPLLNYDNDIAVVWSNTLDAIDNLGDVWGHVVDTYPMPPFKYYAGELLTSFSKAALDGDINLDDHVDFKDVAAMADQWLAGDGCDCYVADLNRNKYVNFTDFAILAKNWLKYRIP